MSAEISLTNPTITNITATTANLSVDTDTGSGELGVTVTDSATEYDALDNAARWARISVGEKADGSAADYSDTMSISSTGTKTFNATGLTPSTTRYAHFLQRVPQ